MKRNILLFLTLIAMSIVFAVPIGNLVNKYVFPGGSWIVPPSVSSLLNGAPYAYLILLPLLFGIWGRGKKWLMIGILSIPVIILAWWASERYLFWSLVFFVSGIMITSIINFFLKRAKV